MTERSFRELQLEAELEEARARIQGLLEIANPDAKAWSIADLVGTAISRRDSRINDLAVQLAKTQNELAAYKQSTSILQDENAKLRQTSGADTIAKQGEVILDLKNKLSEVQALKTSLSVVQKKLEEATADVAALELELEELGDVESLRNELREAKLRISKFSLALKLFRNNASHELDILLKEADG